MPQQTRIETIYSNDDLIIVKKPSFIPTSPLTDDGDEFCLVNLVRKFEPRIMIPSGHLLREGGLIHRLDTPTSGLVLFALNQKTYDELVMQQKKDKIIKQYRARFTERKKLFLEGFPPYPYHDVGTQWGVINSYFRAFGGRGASVRPTLDPRSKHCSGVLYTTETEVESSNTVICTLTRGFRHQVRAHMAWAGYPLAGDTRYGGDESPDFGLEAIGLSFENPSDGAYLTITI